MKKIIKKRKAPKSMEAYIVAALRKIWYYSKLRRDAAAKSKVGNLSRCYVCSNLFEKVQIDHVSAVGSPKNPDGTYDWNRYITRLLYCPPENVKAICLLCHALKNRIEGSLRRQAKAKAVSTKKKSTKKKSTKKK